MDANAVPETMDIKIARRFVRSDGKAVHYRCAGTGPAVVLLHDSPRSSRLHLATMARLAREFQVFALDTPGYGNSDPLALDAPGIEDFAQALGRALEALGLASAPIYATHTSAKIALEYAANHGSPAGLVLDGLSIPTGAPDPQFIETYMRPFVVDAAGGYLASEWTRMRDMLRWFPWFDQRPQTRMSMAMPSDEWIADYIIDYFSAGPAYSSAYRAAMYYDPAPALLSVGRPTLVGAREDDVLFGHLGRVPVDKNPALAVERLTAEREPWLDWIAGSLRKLAAGESGVQPNAANSRGGPLYVDLPHGQMLVHVQGAGESRPPLLILEAPTTLNARRWQQALGDRGTIVPELPGFGESDPLSEPTLEAAADALAAMLDELAVEEADLLALDFATPLGAVMAARHPDRVRKVAFDGAFDLPDEGAALFIERLCPAPAFDWAGAHLHRVWHMLRDSGANWPWFAQEGSARREVAMEADPLDLHRALTGILKQPESYGDLARAACLRPAASRYPGFVQPALVFERGSDPAYGAARWLAEGHRSAQLAPRPEMIADAADTLRAFLDAPGLGAAA